MLREDRRREAVLARTDSVTHLTNSRGFLELLETAVGQTKVICVMYVDLDNFKRVNDAFGHGSGDAVLEQTAAALRDCIRATDVAARVGGDEFAVILREIELADAEAIARRILEKVRLIARDFDGTGLGASLGLAIARRSVSAEELIKAADDAMYDAKQREKGSFAVRVLS
ncbi:MAG TPA: GGDEF domain-containing protein [Thermoanaerobaculia bacterium]|nr:GGDEF domain-containing protein [Thermoanaerobaculia bacterium]